MQSFTVPNTDYHASPASTGIDPSKFDEYFSDGYQKQVLCAAYPHCTAPQPLDSNNSPHRCSGCGLNIHCELWCGTYYNLLEIHPPQLPEYGRSRIQSGEFVPSDSSVLCYRCIEYTEQQQKLPAKDDNAQVSLPSSSLPQAYQLTFEDVMEKGILIVQYEIAS